MAGAATRTVRAAFTFSEKAAYPRYSPHRRGSSGALRFCVRPRGRLSGCLREVDVLGVSQRAPGSTACTCSIGMVWAHCNVVMVNIHAH